jgi:hypothetical protein
MGSCLEERLRLRRDAVHPEELEARLASGGQECEDARARHE